MKKIVMLVATVTLGLGAMNAYAEDRVFPGMLCQQIAGGTPGRGWEGGMFNVSTTSALQVSCPIVRDNLGQSPSDVAVSMFNNTVGQQGCCQFYYSDWFDQNVWWYGSPTCINNSSAVQTFHVPASGVSNLYASEFLFCTLPPQSQGQIASLQGYVVSE